MATSLPPFFGVGSIACFSGLDQVGEGTYGYVYKAKDKRNGETVALKR
jgi:serine/threonine protein kinase